MDGVFLAVSQTFKALGTGKTVTGGSVQTHAEFTVLHAFAAQFTLFKIDDRHKCAVGLGQNPLHQTHRTGAFPPQIEKKAQGYRQ